MAASYEVHEFSDASAIEIGKLLPSLTQPQRSAIFRSYLGLRTSEQFKAPLGLYDQLRVYLYEWLLHLGFLNEVQIRAVLQEIGKDLDRVIKGKEIGLSILDQRYVGVMDWPRIYDAVDSVYIDDTPVPAVTYISCRVLNLLIVKQAWLAKLRGETPDARNPSSAPDV